MSTNTQLAKVSPATLAIGNQFGYTPEYVDLVKRTIAKDADDNELGMFLGICHHAKLNPMNKEIYFWKQAGKVIIHTGIQGLRIAAERTGRYAPGKPVQRKYDENGKLVSSTAFVQKLVAGKWFEIEETALWSEWSRDTQQWKGSYGNHQLDITAERHALKKAFPQLAPIDTSETLGDDPGSVSEPRVESPEDATRRVQLTTDLLRAGELFLSPEQFASLEASLPSSPLTILEDRYQKAEGKLREFVLSEIGKVFQGEAYSQFVIKAFPNSIEGADCQALFDVLDMVNEAEGSVHVDVQPLSDEEEKRASLEEEIMQLVNTKAEGDLEKINEILDGRTLQSMTTERLEAFLEGLKKEDAPF